MVCRWPCRCHATSHHSFSQALSLQVLERGQTAALTPWRAHCPKPVWSLQKSTSSLVRKRRPQVREPSLRCSTSVSMAAASTSWHRPSRLTARHSAGQRCASGVIWSTTSTGQKRLFNAWSMRRRGGSAMLTTTPLFVLAWRRRAHSGLNDRTLRAAWRRTLSPRALHVRRHHRRSRHRQQLRRRHRSPRCRQSPMSMCFAWMRCDLPQWSCANCTSLHFSHAHQKNRSRRCRCQQTGPRHRRRYHRRHGCHHRSHRSHLSRHNRNDQRRAQQSSPSECR